MKPRLLLNLILLAAIVLTGLFAYLDSRKPGTVTPALSSLDPAAVASVRIERPGHPTVALGRRGNAWRMTEPFQARVEPIQVQRLLGFLSASAGRRLPARDLERLELDPPLVQVTVNDENFRFGAVNPVTGEQYVQAGNWVYLVDSRRSADALVPASRLLSPRLLAEEEAPVGFEIGGVALRQTEGKWVLEPPPAAQLSQDDLNRWVQEWRLALAQQVSPLRRGIRPLSTLRLKLAGGGVLAIEVLAREPETVLARPDEGLEYRFPREVGERLLNPPKE